MIGERDEVAVIPKGKLQWKQAGQLLWEHFIAGYSLLTVVIWSCWWALSTAGFLMVIEF